MSAPSPTEFGSRIRHLRVDRGMTIKELGDRIGCSPTHLSAIERGKTSPTLTVLTRIAAALDKPRAYFLEEEELPEVCIVRRRDRRSDPAAEANIVCEFLSLGIPGSRIEARRLRLEPLAASRMHTHPGGEGGLVVAGAIEARVGRKRLHLSAGDAVFFTGERPHQLRNSGDSPAELLWFNFRGGV